MTQSQTLQVLVNQTPLTLAKGCKLADALADDKIQ